MRQDEKHPKATTKNPTAELLPEDVLWAEGGHASDIVLTALADGEAAIVPAQALTHVEHCIQCSRHLGNAALLSLYAQRQIAVMAEHARAEALARLPLPRLPIALGLALAALGLLPSLLVGGSDGVGRTTSFLTHDLPFLARGLETGLRRIFEPGSPSALALTYGTALFLVLVAVVVVRRLPKKEVSR